MTWWPTVMMGGDGHAVVTWGENNVGQHELWFRRCVDGVPVAEAALAARPLGIDGVAVGSNARGDIAFAWGRSSERGVMASHHRAGGRSIAPQLIGPDTSSTEQPDVATNARGEVVVAWVQHAEPDELWARRWSPGNGWAAAHVVHRANDVFRTVDLGLDDAGRAEIVWRDATGAWRSTLTTAGPAAAEAIDATAQADVQWVTVDVRPSGVATLLWVGWVFRDGRAESRVYARHRPAAGVWGAPARLDPGGHDIDMKTVALKAAGDVAWAMWRNESDGRIWTRRRAADAGWGRLRPLPPSYLENAALAANARGAAAAAWVGPEHVVVSRWESGRDDWSAPEAIAKAASTHVDIGLDDQGNAFAVYTTGHAVLGRYSGPAL